MPSLFFERADRRYFAVSLDAGMSHGDLNTYELTLGISTEGGNKAVRTSAIIKHIFDVEMSSDGLLVDLLNHLYVESSGADYRMDSEAFRNLKTKVLDRHGVVRDGDGYHLPTTSPGGAYQAQPVVQVLPLPPRQSPSTEPDARKRVAVIYGQDENARTAMFTFLRALHLQPLEFETIVNESGEGSPFTGVAIDQAFSRAQAIIALITPDEWSALHPELSSAPITARRLQARPNVIFEAGLAFGRQPGRTIIVKYGESALWSDMDGRHYVSMDNTPPRRQALRDRLARAGCLIENVGTDYLTAYAGGNFAAFTRAP
jgi:predicted nucleotide-binding protein